MNDFVSVDCNCLRVFCASVFRALKMPEGEAETAADVLVAADLRGIYSHGTARLRRYVNGLREGQMVAGAKAEVVTETPTSIVLDAQGGMGAPVSVRAMDAVIVKAGVNGCAFGCVRNSNHFGIAAYYAMRALPQGMIGIAMTNTAALAVPTFGRQVMFGTNPLAFAAPADREQAFVLDTSTTVVSRGKIEVYDQAGRDLPPGWAVGKNGKSAVDPDRILTDMLHRHGGGILPLGGEGETHGGHKGYGLAVMVDILCAVLSGAPFADAISDTATTSARVSHFFGALAIDRFRPVTAFRAAMDDLLGRLRSTPPAAGRERVYFAGLKEFESAARQQRDGLMLPRKTYLQLKQLALEFNLHL